ncbi:MAG: hypothetical protein FWD65_00140 [Coriobacteriia bacterium]|nr:hypothetical protein [Coriobacteriia bacterium]
MFDGAGSELEQELFRKTRYRGGVIVKIARTGAIIILLLMILSSGCGGPGKDNRAEKNQVSNEKQKSESIESTVSTPTVARDPNRALLASRESKTNILGLMRKITFEGAFDSAGHEVTLNDVRSFVSVSQLRPFSISDGPYSGSWAYSAHDSLSGGRLFVFYTQASSGEYQAAGCMFVGKTLRFRDFDTFVKGSSTLVDVERVDPATKINFFDCDAATPNYYVQNISIAVFSPEYRCYSAHVTRDGIVDIAYKKERQNFVVGDIYETPDDRVASINPKDWP